MDDLIDRQAALDALEWKWAGKAAIDAIKNLPSAQPEQRWIPVSESLPKDGKKRYWVCTDTGYQCECRWTNINHIWTELTTDWHWHIMDIPQYSHVVAWRELPEPYKEEQDERFNQQTGCFTNSK
jgi:hypothetical protein